MKEILTVRDFKKLFIFCIVLFPSVALPASVDLFPIPISSSTTLFPAIPNYAPVDDSYLEVPFTQGFTFRFYGVTYSSIFLNTNGGFTFGSGNADWSLAASEVTQPGVAVFWGDMNAQEAANRAYQMTYEQFSDRFVIKYTRFQEHDAANYDNTATVTLYSNGDIVIQYGNVLSKEILMGVFNGNHTSDQYLSVQGTYDNYQSYGSGIILFDDSGKGPAHNGELSNQTITFLAGQDSTTVIAVPALTGWGMIIFTIIAALMSIYYLRKKVVS